MKSVITVTADRADEPDLQSLRILLAAPVVRLTDGATTVEIPASVRDALRGLLERHSDDDAFAVVRTDAEVSPGDAARLLGVSRQYVDRLISAGSLPARRLPGSRYRRVPVHAVLAYRDDLDTTTGRASPRPPAVVDVAGIDSDASDGDESDTESKAATTATARGRARRARLVDATARLVAERGFHSVGISEIAAAAGVTGAAIYRHFPNKTQMLVAVLDQVVDELLDGSARILATDTEPSATLELLVRHHVQLVLRNPAVFGIYLQEAHNLPPEDRSRLRRNQRTYVLRWATLLGELRPELSRDDSRTRSQVTFGLLNSLAEFPSPLRHDELAALLTAMALASLTA